jgi:hypothetical protein
MMKKLFFGVLTAVLVISGCSYISVERHIMVNLDDVQPFEASNQFDKKFKISTGQIINAITDNIDTKNNPTIKNLQIEKLQLSISLLPNNSATSLHNIHIRLGKGWPTQGETLAKLDTSRVPVNQGLIYAANVFLVLKGVEQVKKGLNDFLVTKQGTEFELDMSGFIPAGQVFRGSIKLILRASFDAVTCEEVPIGFGPSECMILPFVVHLN